MVVKQRPSLSIASDELSVALANVAVRLSKWKTERSQIVAELDRVQKVAGHLLGDIGASKPRLTGGRPKGYKMSAATKAKLRAAWKRRKAALSASTSLKG